MKPKTLCVNITTTCKILHLNFISVKLLIVRLKYVIIFSAASILFCLKKPIFIVLVCAAVSARSEEMFVFLSVHVMKSIPGQHTSNQVSAK